MLRARPASFAIPALAAAVALVSFARGAGALEYSFLDPETGRCVRAVECSNGDCAEGFDCSYGPYGWSECRPAGYQIVCCALATGA